MPTYIHISKTEKVMISENEKDGLECYHYRFFIEDLSGKEYFTHEDDGKKTWKMVDNIILSKTDFEALKKKYEKDLTEENLIVQIKEIMRNEEVSNRIGE